MTEKKPTIGWSDFAILRHREGTGHSYYDGKQSNVTQMVKDRWEDRVPGDGETGYRRKVLVRVPADGFVCPTIDIEHFAGSIRSRFIDTEVRCRQDGEDLFVSDSVQKKTLDYLSLQQDKPVYVDIVLYSADALTENGGERSTNRDWEIVCVIASPVENEPMEPLTLARNFLEKPGGTKSTYTAQQFAESIYYWSQKIRVK